VHPDVVEIDPAATQIRIEDAQAIVDEVSRSPIEGERKVVIVFDAERLRLNEAAANKLLKTLEEPPPRAVIILVTSGADQLLPTIRSRCQRVDFAYLGAESVAAALVADGVPAARAELLARLAGGRIDRARALDGRLGPVRDAFVAVAAAVDGTGGAVAVHAERVQAAMQEALAGLEAAQAAEAEQLATELEAAGYRERTRRAQLRRLEERHKRAHRRARIDTLLEGITALETVYRDALAASPYERLNLDLDVLVVNPRAAAGALDACRAARQALGEFSPNESLLVERLFLHLPPAGGGRQALPAR
jgi:DNA polymerase-3 subunit delta'